MKKALDQLTTRPTSKELDALIEQAQARLSAIESSDLAQLNRELDALASAPSSQPEQLNALIQKQATLTTEKEFLHRRVKLLKEQKAGVEKVEAADRQAAIRKELAATAAASNALQAQWTEVLSTLIKTTNDFSALLDTWASLNHESEFLRLQHSLDPLSLTAVLASPKEDHLFPLKEALSAIHRVRFDPYQARKIELREAREKSTPAAADPPMQYVTATLVERNPAPAAQKTYDTSRYQVGLVSVSQAAPPKPTMVEKVLERERKAS